VIEIIDGVAREYEWVDGEWILKAGSPWNEDTEPPLTEGEG